MTNHSDFTCPNCGGEPNMVLKITTEQQARFYHRLPNRIATRSRKSLNGTWVEWDGPIPWTCPNCRKTGRDLLLDCAKKQADE